MTTNNFLEKTASALGYEAETQVSNATLAGKSINAFLSQVSLASLLFYQTFDPATELYYNETNLGFVLEIAPLLGGSQETVKALNGILTDILPDGAISQWLLWASPKIEQAISSWTQARSVRGGWYEKLAKEREAHLLKGAYSSLIKSAPHSRLRNYRCFVSVNLPLGEKEEAQLLEIRDKIQSVFAVIKSHSSIMRPKQLLSLLYDMVNPSKTPYSAEKKWETSRSLAGQMVSPETKLTLTENALTLSEDYVVTTYSVEQLPEQWAQHLNAELLGSEENAHRHPLGEFYLSAVVRPLNVESAKTRALFQNHQAEKTVKGMVAKFLPRAGKIYSDWKYATAQLDAGERLVEIAYQAMCYSPKNEVGRAESAIKEVFNAKGWKLKRDSYISLQTWLTMLPMRVDNALFDDLKYFNRIRTVLSLNATNLLPIQGEWKGGSSPGILLFGRRGQAIWVDNFANQEGNYNVIVTGMSRSGKSVLLQEQAFSVASHGGRVIVFDIGRSFEKSCKQLGGQFIEFHPDSPICINPFTTILDFNESISLLLPLYAKMASNKRELDDIEESYLQQAIRATWQIYGNQGDADKIAKWLATHHDVRARDLSTMLDAWTNEGQYGRYVNGMCTLDFNNPYIVLELEELSGKKELQSVVLMTMMYHVTEVMYRGDRTQKIQCIIDEAWDLLDDKLGGKFIEVGYRRAAKYKGAFMSGTQTLQDYDKSDSSRAIKANSSQVIILKQEPDIIEKAALANLIDDTPHFKMTLKSLRTEAGQYAEMCIKIGSSYSVARLLLDPFSSTLYSSKAEHVNSVKAFLKSGYSHEQAIRLTSERILREEI
ncbi:MAG: type IV secretion system protein TraC [Legionellales bacterium]|nr:type IV secretion system protein TraC [Legionellales bacterium]